MASKDSKPSSICPECKTPQFGQSPFCEHCGFRLRSQETALEGVPAITPSQLQSVSRGRASTQEEPSITADQVKQQSPSQTFVEGLPPVKRQPRQPQPTPAPPSGEYSQPAIAPAEISALMPMAPPPPNKLAWLIPLITGLMCGGILGTAFTWIGTKNSNSKAQEHLLPASPPNERIAFAQTSFTQGLDEPTRARILRLCYNSAKTPTKNASRTPSSRMNTPRNLSPSPPFISTPMKPPTPSTTPVLALAVAMKSTSKHVRSTPRKDFKSHSVSPRFSCKTNTLWCASPIHRHKNFVPGNRAASPHIRSGNLPRAAQKTPASFPGETPGILTTPTGERRTSQAPRSQENLMALTGLRLLASFTRAIAPSLYEIWQATSPSGSPPMRPTPLHKLAAAAGQAHPTT